MDKSEIINRLIEKNGYTSYLEIGLDGTDNFRKVICRDKESVDPYFNVNGHNGERMVCDSNGELFPYIKECLTYHCTSDELFAERIDGDKRYDIVFIDGLHERKQILRDIVNSMKHLNEGGMLVCHDCLPYSEKAQMVPRIVQDWNGDVWKTMRFLIEKGFNIEVVDDDFGCSLIRYDKGICDVDVSEEFDYEYNEVFADREVRNKMMNVISVEEFLGKYIDC